MRQGIQVIKTVGSPVQSILVRKLSDQAVKAALPEDQQKPSVIAAILDAQKDILGTAPIVSGGEVSSKQETAQEEARDAILGIFSDNAAAIKAAMQAPGIADALLRKLENTNNSWQWESKPREAAASFADAVERALRSPIVVKQLENTKDATGKNALQAVNDALGVLSPATFEKQTGRHQ